MKHLKLIILLAVISTAAHAKSLSPQSPASEKPVLNHGAKWVVDKTTCNNIINLQRAVNAADSKTPKDLRDYQQAATTLQSGITKLMRQCRMQGAAHLALHKWLEPLIKQVAKLNQVTNTVAASASFDAVKAQLSLFDRYFQCKQD